MFGDDFGNTFLDKLQEISLPEAVAWTPQTPGWYVLGLLVLLGLVRLAVALHRRRAANRYRRAALAELGAIGSKATGERGPARAITEIAELLKRTALAAFPRAEVAGLSGAAWLDFLDRSSGSTDFSGGPGRLLADGPYQRSADVPDADIRELLILARRWIRGHRRPDGGSP